MASGTRTAHTESMSEVTRFELPIRVEEADIDALGHVNNVTYVRWVQDAAVAHWTAAAPAAEQARLLWIVLRHDSEKLFVAMQRIEQG